MCALPDRYDNYEHLHCLLLSGIVGRTSDRGCHVAQVGECDECSGKPDDHVLCGVAFTCRVNARSSEVTRTESSISRMPHFGNLPRNSREPVRPTAQALPNRPGRRTTPCGKTSNPPLDSTSLGLGIAHTCGTPRPVTRC